MTDRFGCLFVIFGAMLSLAACGDTFKDRPDPLAKNVIDEANLTDLLLTAGDPNESVAYFQGALAQDPDRVDYQRGLAVSLTRAKRLPEAARIYQEMIASGRAQPADRLDYALVAAQLDKWTEVKSILIQLPGGLNTGRRHMVEGMLADHEQNWAAADAAYARAETLSTNPANVLNNWGVSRMSRGDLPAAAQSFEKALSLAMPISATAMPKWATIMPHVASGTRRSRRP